MKTSDKYRFTLQWSAETDEKIRAGELLESLGNRKSEFIVLAISDYLAAHPGIFDEKKPLSIVVKPSLTQAQIKAIVLAILEEKLPDIHSIESRPDDFKHSIPMNEIDIEEMIKNLDVFLP